MWWKKCLFTAFYMGYSPIAPGTLGTIIALAIYILEYLIFGNLSWIVNLVVVLVMLYPSIKLGDEGEAYFGKKDPSEVVLDEVIGYWVSVLLYPFNWKIAILAFFIFRITDIVKPYPINTLQKLEGGLGIVIDDIIAGVYTNLIILVIMIIL